MREKDKRTLQEADRIRLEQYVTEDLDDMVDYRTGEILSSRVYTTHPMARGEKNEGIPDFGSIVSHHQMKRFMEVKDRRRLRIFNECRAIYDMDKGRAYFESAAVVMSTSIMCKLNLLISRLDYRNVIVASPREISYVLGVDHRNLYRHLRTLRNLVTWKGPDQGIKQGSLKVEVCPVYGFRYEAGFLDSARVEAVKEWYRDQCRRLGNEEALVIGDAQSRHLLWGEGSDGILRSSG